MEQKIREYLAESLPPGEERIPEPMNPACEVCVVIPAYGEREFILWPLESLARQRDITAEQFEVIIVVNNRDYPPGKKPGESDAVYRQRLENFNNVLGNNRETLMLINHIKNPGIAIALTSEEETVIRMIKQVGLKVYAVDKSGKGRTLAPADANVGGARNRGVAEAVERFYKLGKNGIIAHTDADTRVEGSYIRNLIRAFKQNPRLTGLAGFDEDTLEDPRAKVLMKDSLLGQALSMYDFMVFNLFFMEKTFPSIYFVGSTMASRAFETAATGGIARVSGGEDYDLAQKMEEIGEIVWDKEVVTFPIIRYSPRTTTGKGFHMVQCASDQHNEQKGKEIMVRSIEAAYYLHNTYVKLQEARNNQQTSVADLEKILSIDNKPILETEELQRFSRSIHLFHSYMVDLLNEDLRELVKKICDRFDAQFKPVPFTRSIPLMIKMFCLKDMIKKSYDARRVEMVQQRKHDLETIEYLLDNIFPKEQNTLEPADLADIITVLLENNSYYRTSHFFKKRFRIRRAAELIDLSHSKTDALELINVNFMKYLFLPDLPGSDPEISAFFELQVLSKTMRSLNRE